MRKIHKKFSSEQVKEVLDKYEKSIFKKQITEQLLGIKLSQFFNLLKGYRNDKAKFSIDYRRSTNTNENETERLILYFRVHLRILNRKEISIKTGIFMYKIVIRCSLRPLKPILRQLKRFIRHPPRIPLRPIPPSPHILRIPLS